MIFLRNGGKASNITKMYLFEILTGVVFYGAVMMTFQELQGLSLSEVFYSKIGFVMSMALMEAPTGYFADVYGRKLSLIVGSVVELMALILFAFSDSFLLFLSVDILMGLALALFSGATSALVYETLDEENRAMDYQKIWGDMQFYQMVSMAVSAVIGGLVAHKYGLVYAVYINIPFVLLVLFVTMSLDEPARKKVVVKKGYSRVFIVNIGEVFKSSRGLQLIVVYSALIYIFNQSIFPAYQHYYMIAGVDLLYFGAIHALLQVVAAFSSKYTYRVEHHLGRRNTLLIIPFMVAISYLLMGTFIGVWSFLFILLQQFVRGFRAVVVSDYINQLVGSEQRATILSMESLFSQMLIAPMLLLWGLSLEFISLEHTMQLLGVVGLFMGLIIWYFIAIKKVIE